MIFAICVDSGLWSANAPVGFIEWPTATGQRLQGCNMAELNRIRVQTDYSGNSYDTHEMEFSYEEMVEILAAIRDTPIRGNELFDSAKEKACALLKMMPESGLLTMTNLVFVYGTLKKGFGNHRLLTKAKFIANACIFDGKMLDLGAFPALVEGDMDIEGELYEVDKATFAALDRLEGHPTFYKRKRVEAYFSTDEYDMATAEAWCYFLSKNSQVHYEKLCPVIEEGIWNGRH